MPISQIKPILSVKKKQKLHLQFLQTLDVTKDISLMVISGSLLVGLVPVVMVIYSLEKCADKCAKGINVILKNINE